MVLTSVLCLALASDPTPRVLVDAPHADLTVVTNALLERFTVVPVIRTLGPDPSADQVVASCAADRSVVLISTRHSAKSWTARVLNCVDGELLDTVSLKITRGRMPKALPAALRKQLTSAVERGAEPAPLTPPPPPPPPLVAEVPVMDQLCHP